MLKTITYIGLDVHKDTIAAALDADLRGEVREYGKIANTPAAMKTLTSKLTPRGGELPFCYEASPCGYGIQRQLTGVGHDCVVVAPSLIPQKPGERTKTDRRDAVKLAKLPSCRGIDPVWVLDRAHEAIRDLVRARQAAVRSLRQARQQLSSFLRFWRKVCICVTLLIRIALNSLAYIIASYDIEWRLHQSHQ